jgi:dTDP-4-amino-4,6-dideoxygalactose transaminase
VRHVAEISFYTVVTHHLIPPLRPQLPSALALQPYLERIDSSRVYSNFGPLVSELEARLSGLLGSTAGTVTSAASGTSALVGAVLAVAGRARPERPLALIPAYTFVATAVAAELCGYTPWLVDVDSVTWAADPDRLADHPELGRVGVILAVAPFGAPPDQQGWAAFQDRTGIPVVLDAAASVEAVMAAPGRCIGDVPVVLSLHATKPLAAGEGGAVVSADRELVLRIASALNFGFQNARDSSLPSTNGKLSEYHAAVALASLDGWAARQAKVAEVHSAYRDRAQEAGIGRRLVLAPEVASTYALLVCSDEDEAGRVRYSCEAAGVDTRLWYGRGVQANQWFSTSAADALDVTRCLAPRVIGLPMAIDLRPEQVELVVTAVVRGLAAG